MAKYKIWPIMIAVILFAEQNLIELQIHIKKATGSINR